MASQQHPRISVNKLGEYLITANPARRRAIVSDQKNPNPAVVPRYRQALPAIASFLTSGTSDEDAIVRAIEDIRAKPTSSDWAQSDNKNTADALERFLEVADELLDDTFTYVPGSDQAPKLVVAGVEVSVRPDFLIHFRSRGKDRVGALKFHFVRDDDKSLSEKGGEYVSTMLYRWLQVHGPQGRSPDRRQCVLVDCFRTRVVVAPASHVRRYQHIEAACEEICAKWPTA